MHKLLSESLDSYGVTDKLVNAYSLWSLFYHFLLKFWNWIYAQRFQLVYSIDRSIAFIKVLFLRFVTPNVDVFVACDFLWVQQFVCILLLWYIQHSSIEVNGKCLIWFMQKKKIREENPLKFYLINNT